MIDERRKKTSEPQSYRGTETKRRDETTKKNGTEGNSGNRDRQSKDEDE